MNAIWTFLIVALGTARLTALISRDSIFEPMRDLIFHWFPPEDNARLGWRYQQLWKADKRERELSLEHHWWRRRWIDYGETMREPSFIGELIGCPFCLSVWIAFFNWPLSTVEPAAGPMMALNTILAISYIAAVGVHKGGWR